MTTTAPLTLADLSGDYAIDASHSRIGFVARHVMIAKVRGQFNSFEGTLKLNGANPEESSAEITIDASSVDTSNQQRDDHLRSGDFFANDEFPSITFKTTKIEGDGEEYQITGDLTIRGITKSVTFDAEILGYGLDGGGNTRVGFEGSAVVNRQDWNINWNMALEAGGVMVSDKVTLEFEFSAVRQ